MLLLSCTLLALASAASPLHSAIAAGDVVAAQAAIASATNAELNEINTGDGRTPIMAATLSGHTAIVAELLKSPAVDLLIGERDGYTPVHGAGFQGRADIMWMLLQAGADVNTAHRDGFTPLARALWGNHQRHADTVRVLVVDAGVDGTAAFNTICTPPDQPHGPKPGCRWLKGHLALVHTGTAGHRGGEL